MRVKIKLFSIFKDVFNAKELTIEFDKDSISVDELLERLSLENPRFKEVLNYVKPIVLVNGESQRSLIVDGDEVAIVPPASGGVKYIHAALFKEDREVDIETRIRRIIESVSGSGVGAIAIFIGIVKDFVDGKAVKELIYEAYEPYATKALEKIAFEEAEKGGVEAIEILHRVGSAKPGEKTVFIAVASKNRANALETLARVLERVKHEVPIFKLEVREDGEYYVIGDGKRIKRGVSESF